MPSFIKTFIKMVKNNKIFKRTQPKTGGPKQNNRPERTSVK